MLWMMLMLGCTAEAELESEGWDWLLCSIEDDDNADWTADYVITYAYDDQGHEVLEAQDLGADGVIELAWRSTWDEHGWLASEARDVDADGVLEDIVRYEHDAQGHLLAWTADQGADGTEDLWYEATWEGDLLMLEEEGEGDVPEPVRVTTHTYDQRGLHVLAEVTHPEDPDLNWRHQWTYDEQGHYTRSWHEWATGELRYELSYVHDAQGALLDQWMNMDGDGAWDSHHHWERDAQGLALVYERDDEDDGTVDQRQYYTYDDLGQEITREWDQDADGSIDLRTSMAWDDWGHNTHESTDHDMDDLPDRRITYTWAATCE